MLFGQLHTSTAISKSLECLHSRFLQGVSVCSSFIGLTLMERCRFHTVVQGFKVLYRLCPAYLRDWFVYAEAYRGCRGCNEHHLYIPQIQTTVGKMDFFIEKQ